ncbi:MAG: response regulator [Bacteroidota bacterium]
MDNVKILWADDEIDLLKPQIMFLEKQGYEVITVTNGYDAIEEIQENNALDVVFLDESMPGLTGLETLAQIREFNAIVPIVMITKNEEENVMEDALGAQITDYLIKPVKPNKILFTLKKIVDEKRLVREKTTSDYQQGFRQIFMEINSGLDYMEWVETYRKIINWEIKLDAAKTGEMADILAMQKAEANTEFSKFIVKNYVDWVNEHEDGPVMSYNLMRKKVFPDVVADVPTIFLLLDNLRYDQWKTIEPIISDHFRVDEEDYFYSILPTSTQYSRNAIFAGMMPSEIQEYYPEWWKNDNEQGGKNLFEKQLLAEQIDRVFHKDIKFDYIKVTNANDGKLLIDNIMNFLNNRFTVIVYNFIDMLSHARTEMEVLKELAGDETAYRSLTKSWFENSFLWTALKKVADKKIKLVITTDHGTIRVKQPSKVIGDRETTTNLRYKVGKNLQYDKKDVLDVKEPKKALLPRPNVSSTFIFAKEDKFFLYPNNYNHYNNYYKNTFQHGGISLEEMIVPVIKLSSR